MIHKNDMVARKNGVREGDKREERGRVSLALALALAMQATIVPMVFSTTLFSFSQSYSSRKRSLWGAECTLSVYYTLQEQVGRE